MTATVAIRNLGHYCDLTHNNPKEILNKVKANEKNFGYKFADFVRDMES